MHRSFSQKAGERGPAGGWVGLWEARRRGACGRQDGEPYGGQGAGVGGLVEV